MAEDQTPSQNVPAEARKPTWPEGAGPLVEGMTAATKHPVQNDTMTPRKREWIWSEVHDPFDTTTAEVDPRASGDPLGVNPPPNPLLPRE
jgi:hypothetical protein